MSVKSCGQERAKSRNLVYTVLNFGCAFSHFSRKCVKASFKATVYICTYVRYYESVDIELKILGTSSLIKNLFWGWRWMERFIISGVWMCSVELDFDISWVNVSICGDIPSLTLCNQRCTLQEGCCWVTLLMTALVKIECQVSIYQKIWPISLTTSINWISFQFVMIWNCMKMICSRFRWNFWKSNWHIISFYVQWKVNDFNMRSRNCVDLNLHLVFQDADSLRRPNSVFPQIKHQLP